MAAPIRPNPIIPSCLWRPFPNSVRAVYASIPWTRTPPEHELCFYYDPPGKGLQSEDSCAPENASFLLVRDNQRVAKPLKTCRNSLHNTPARRVRPAFKNHFFLKATSEESLHLLVQVKTRGSEQVSRALTTMMQPLDNSNKYFTAPPAPLFPGSWRGTASALDHGRAFLVGTFFAKQVAPVEFHGTQRKGGQDMIFCPKSAHFRKYLAVAVVVMAAVCGTVAGVAAEPCLELRKEGPVIAHPGDFISFALTAHNCGDVYLGSSVGIYDPLVWDQNTDYVGEDYVEASGLVWAKGLAAGETATTVVNYLVTENDCGELVNTALVQSPYNNSYGYITVQASATWTVTIECTQPGTGTPGYWKNHPEAWPVEEITIGGITYSKADAMYLLASAVRKDKTITMFKGLLSAMLNVLIGNDSSCISGTIGTADAWLAENPVGSQVEASSYAWTSGEPVSTKLDDYNNGMLCAPARD